MTTFTFDAAARHIRKKHPGCPDFAITYMAQEISAKEWHGVSLGRAVGITIQGILRHRMTDYDALLLQGVDRGEARKRVQPKIEAMLKVWLKPRTAAAENE